MRRVLPSGERDLAEFSGDSVDHRNRAGDACGSHARRAPGVAGQNVSDDQVPSEKDDRTWTYVDPSTAVAGDRRSSAYCPSGADLSRGAGRNSAAEVARDSAVANSADIACVEDMDCVDRTGRRGFLHDSCRHQVDRPTRRPGTRHMPGSRTPVLAAKPLTASSLSTSTERSTQGARPPLIRPQQMTA